MTVNDEKDIIDNTFNPYAEIDLFSVDGKNHRLNTLLCRFEVKDYEGFSKGFIFNFCRDCRLLR